MRIFGIAGRSGCGKTTLIAALLGNLRGRGLAVSTVKQAAAHFDPETPGKDSWRHREAGAREVLVVSDRRWALMHERPPDAGEPPPLVEMLPRLAPADMVLVEGYRRDPLPRLEVWRPAVGKDLLAPDDPRILAVASDGPVPALTDGRPVLDLNDVAVLAAFVLEHAEEVRP